MNMSVQIGNRAFGDVTAAADFSPLLESGQLRLTDILRIWSQTAVHPSCEVFYTYAQSINIGANIADIEFDTDLARAYVLSHAPVAYLGSPSRAMISIIPNYHQIHRRIAQSLMIDLDVDPALYDSPDLAACKDMMEAIEYRDLMPMQRAPRHLPTPSAPYVVNDKMTPAQARTYLGEYMDTLFAQALRKFHAKSVSDLMSTS